MKKFLLLGLLLSTVAFASVLKDGVYTAETAKEHYGWKSGVEITVTNGKISKVVAEDLNAKGEVKSKDAKYNDSWMKKSNTNFTTARETWAKELIAKQDASKIDAVAGATSGTDTFKKLATAAIKKAEAGDTTKAIVD